ncbi:MAG: hypothetical protein K9M84_14355, partial [Spirochaetia bacterium]|nr:hypothetical protein [Spirochaetia bacterium]
MKNTHKNYILIFLMLVPMLLFFVGCSDMMERMGDISLTIELDIPEMDVSYYTLEGSLSDSSRTFLLEEETALTYNLSSLDPGTWTLTVTAFDEDDQQIGTGTRMIVLREGQILETSVLVVFGQSPPEGLTASPPSRYDSEDGEITGTTAKMEYKLSTAGEDAYATCSDEKTILASGSYHLRFAAAHGLNPSETVTVIIPEYVPIQLTVSGTAITASKVYDGTTDAEVTKVGSLEGIITGDEVTVSAASAAYADAAAGNDKTITISYTLGGDEAANYTISDDTSTTADISRKTLTVSGTAITASKVYDGTTDAEVTKVGSLEGIITGDEVTVSAASAAYADAAAGNAKIITISYTLSGADAANYTISDDTSTTASISKATYDMSAISFADSTVTYDGSAQSLLISGTLPTGVSVSYSDNSQTNAGTYEVTAHFSGDSDNYELISDLSATLIIERATMSGSITITGNTVYGETLTADPNLTNAGTPTYQWYRSSSAISGATSTTYTLVSADIGSAITV